jgi:hypothetical protein
VRVEFGELTVTTWAARIPACLVVCDGQSLNILPGPAVGFPAQCEALLSATACTRGDVVAIGSTSYLVLSQTQATRCNRHAHTTPLPIWHGVGGTSDVLNGDTAATMYANIKAYVLAAKAAGFAKAVITTITPSTGFTAGQNTQRQAANDLLIGNADAAFDRVVDLACDSTLSNPGAPPSGTTYYGTGHLANPADTTYYNADGLHWKAAGCADAASSCVPALRSVGAT